jgi:hypothetical protein
VSKQIEAKKRQRWQAKQFLPVCGNCEHFQFDTKATSWGATKEINMRCTLGGFATKKMSGCDLFAAKREE